MNAWLWIFAGGGWTIALFMCVRHFFTSDRLLKDIHKASHPHWNQIATSVDVWEKYVKATPEGKWASLKPGSQELKDWIGARLDGFANALTRERKARREQGRHFATGWGRITDLTARYERLYAHFGSLVERIHDLEDVAHTDSPYITFKGHDMIIGRLVERIADLEKIVLAVKKTEEGK